MHRGERRAQGSGSELMPAGKVKDEKGSKFAAELPSGVVLGELAALGPGKRRTATVMCKHR